MAQIAGFCVVDWKQEAGRKLGHFITIDVAPEFRRNGLGRLLMQAGEANLIGDGLLRDLARSSRQQCRRAGLL